MSNISIDSWNDFMFKVGEDFYTFIHGEDENSTEYTAINYPNTVDYTGMYFLYLSGNSNSYRFPVLGHFRLDIGDSMVYDNVTALWNCNYTGANLLNDYDTPVLGDFNITVPHSFFVSNDNFWLNSTGYIGLKNASNAFKTNIFKIEVDGITQKKDGTSSLTFSGSASQQQIKLSTDVCSLTKDSGGYEYLLGLSNPNSAQSIYANGAIKSNPNAPTVCIDYPFIVNTVNVNTSATVINNIKNNYISNSGDTITNYTYNIDNDNYITVNYSTDGDGVPTGFIDINPTGQISFDDLFDMFNTILAPLVGIGLDLPDWNDYLPPVVTGDVNIDVNIDLPNVTGVYPSETITPIDSDVYNIMSIDSMPQLPSLTGIDNGETAAALGSSFSFLDGCGLLMPFVTIAIIRLLISKFRGDS